MKTREKKGYWKVLCSWRPYAKYHFNTLREAKLALETWVKKEFDGGCDVAEIFKYATISRFNYIKDPGPDCFGFYLLSHIDINVCVDSSKKSFKILYSKPRFNRFIKIENIKTI